MPKFVFSLQTLLQHRDDMEQKELDQLFRLNYKYQNEMRHRDGLVAKFRETMKDLSKQQSLDADPKELQLFHLYLHRLTQEIGESEKRLAAIQAEVEAQKLVVIEASKKKKVLVSLKDKKKKEFVMEMDKQEQKEVDDLVVTRYVAK